MSDSKEEKKQERRQKKMTRDIGRKAVRKQKARRFKEEHSLWFGLGMFGLVGWSVAIPTLISLALGIWLDSRLEDRFSWTLMFLFIGIVLGCINAWYWVSRERDLIQKEEDDSND